MSLSINDSHRLTASFQGPGYLSAHLNMSDRPKEGEISRRVCLRAFDTSNQTETVALDWPALDLEVGDVVELQILPEGEGDPPTETRRSSEAPGNLLSSSELAKQVLQAVSEFDAHLMNLLARAEATEPSDEYQKFRSAIGYVFAETGERLVTPIHRRHQELIPEALRGELL